LVASTSASTQNQYLSTAQVQVQSSNKSVRREYLGAILSVVGLVQSVDVAAELIHVAVESFLVACVNTATSQEVADDGRLGPLVNCTQSRSFAERRVLATFLYITGQISTSST